MGKRSRRSLGGPVKVFDLDHPDPGVTRRVSGRKPASETLLFTYVADDTEKGKRGGVQVTLAEWNQTASGVTPDHADLNDKLVVLDYKRVLSELTPSQRARVHVFDPLLFDSWREIKKTKDTKRINEFWLQFK